MGRFGFVEILLIIVLVFLLFGANKFPGMMKNLADGLKVFKKEIKEPVSAPAKSSAVKKAAKKPVKKTTKKAAKKTIKKTAKKKR